MALMTPLVLFAYNRPHLTEKVLAKIIKVKPKKIFLIVDGPKKEDSVDYELCMKTRKVLGNINWDCEVHRIYSNINLGCNTRIISGLNLVFEEVEEAIILEDDTIPDATFFSFCEELLQLYRGNELIMMIAGHNPLGFWNKNNSSYFYSNFGGVWGWATWKRAWSLFNDTYEEWNKPNARKCVFDILQNEIHSRHRISHCSKFFDSKNGTWDYGWSFTRFLNSGLTIVPKTNLVSNIGFSNNATHTKMKNRNEKNGKLTSIDFPLIHPIEIIADRDFDEKKFNIIH